MQLKIWCIEKFYTTGGHQQSTGGLPLLLSLLQKNVEIMYFWIMRMLSTDGRLIPMTDARHALSEVANPYLVYVFKNWHRSSDCLLTVWCFLTGRWLRLIEVDERLMSVSPIDKRPSERQRTMFLDVWEALWWGVSFDTDGQPIWVGGRLMTIRPLSDV